MVTAQCFHDISRKLISCNTNALIANNTRQSNYGNTCCTTANINNHITYRFFYINTYTQCSCHRFMYQVNFFGSCLLGTISYRTFFNFSNAAWYAYHHTPAWCKQWFFGVNEFYHFPYHQLCCVKIGNYTVFKRTNRSYTFVGFFMHHQCFFAHS